MQKVHRGILSSYIRIGKLESGKLGTEMIIIQSIRCSVSKEKATITYFNPNESEGIVPMKL